MNKPNIILITTEGQAWNHFGFAGDAHARTPNIDGLAAHGIQFTRATTQSLDTHDARSCLLSGRYRSNGESMAHALRRQGYACAIVGASPLEDHSDFDLARLTPGSNVLAGESDYAQYLRGVGIDMPGAPPGEEVAYRSPLPADHHPIAWIGSQAVRCVQQLASPFFLCMNFSSPSVPYDPPMPWNHHCTVPAGEHGSAYARAQSHYYGLGAFIDQQLGRVMATLSARGISQTVMAYTAVRGDRIGMGGEVGVNPRDATEADVRIPFLIAGAPKQRRGIVLEDPVELVDIAPTLLSLAGMTEQKNMHGVSLSNLLAQPARAPREGSITMLPEGAAAWYDEKGLLECNADGEPQRFIPAHDQEEPPLTVGGAVPPAIAIRARRINATRKRFGI